MNNYALSKVANNLDQWNLYDDSNNGEWIATINGENNALQILNLLNQDETK